MSRWASNTETEEPKLTELWRVTLTWIEWQDGRRESMSRQRFFATREEADAKVCELDRLIKDGRWVPVIGATDLEVDGPDRLGGS